MGQGQIRNVRAIMVDYKILDSVCLKCMLMRFCHKMFVQCSEFNWLENSTL